MNGRAHVFGDNVNTDYITPSDYFGLPLEDIAEHVFEPIAPDFVEQFESGDVIIAGENFGSGSSRETAPAALKELGVAAVVAESFARLYYRNSIAIGLPAITCPGVATAVESGDVVEVDLEQNAVRNLDTGVVCDSEPLNDTIQEIFDAGGLLAHYNSSTSEFTTD